MGDLQGAAATEELTLIPKDAFTRLAAADLDPVQRTEIFADMCRINTLYMIKRAGSGHIGTSFSSQDIMAWIHLNELREETGTADVFFSSKGHDAPALYAVLAATGKLEFEMIHRLRRLDGLPGHPDVQTPAIWTNTGSLGMGISKAKGMVRANRHAGLDGRIFVMTGDGELQEGQIWESLGSAVNQGLSEITVIVDHNKLQSDTFVETVSDLGDLEAKFRAFGWHVERCNGNDVSAFAKTMRTVAEITDRPKVIIADTIKGSGVTFIQHTALASKDSMYKFHSGAPSTEHYKDALAELQTRLSARTKAASLDPVPFETSPPAKSVAGGNATPERLVDAYSRVLIEAAEKIPNLYALDADLVLDTGLIPFRDRFPERFVECGIAEQDMVSQAGGMALTGLLPVVHSFSCFLSTRPNEQIFNNATEGTKIIYVGTLSGIIPAGPGHSHQSVRDLSIVSAVPGMTVIQPANEAEVAAVMRYCFERASGSCWVRLVSVPTVTSFSLPDDYVLTEGQGTVLRDGSDAVLFAYGPTMLSEACLAADKLREERDFGLRVVNLPWLNKVDAQWLADTVAGYHRVFTLDDQYLIGGQGDMIAASVARSGMAGDKRVRSFGIGPSEVPACGTKDEVLRHHGLDADSLSREIAAS